ncbi:hypothetical protein [Streptomyces sp. AS02]|uniref:hypothetical protein n=1 Tax=Streptomyces sp. AS02 TaxID=2938946 RepID=UPI0020212C2F|nr:hypothetical protein [Streptomyces sp. AS02]MCL8016922.1 hypothetical protein [Streptomyces sp. AS02]
MPEHTPGYVAALGAAEHQQYINDLAGQLARRHPALLTPQLRIPLLRTQLALYTRLLATAVTK